MSWFIFIFQGSRLLLQLSQAAPRLMFWEVLKIDDFFSKRSRSRGFFPAIHFLKFGNRKRGARNQVSWRRRMRGKFWILQRRKRRRSAPVHSLDGSARFTCFFFLILYNSAWIKKGCYHILGLFHRPRFLRIRFASETLIRLLFCLWGEKVDPKVMYRRTSSLGLWRRAPNRLLNRQLWQNSAPILLVIFLRLNVLCKIETTESWEKTADDTAFKKLVSILTAQSLSFFKIYWPSLFIFRVNYFVPFLFNC